MTERIAIDTRQLLSSTKTMGELLDNTKNELKELYEAVEAMNGMWTGPANDSFRSQFAQDEQTAYELCDAMRQYIQSMTYAVNAYDICEKKVTEMIEVIRI